MKSILILTLAIMVSALVATEPVGKWTFDDSADLLNADAGTDLTLVGSHTAVAGPTAANGAVRIGPGSFYRCYHDIPANGGGTWVNEYSLYIDFKVPSIGQWYCFFQTSYSNSNDGDAFVNTSGQVGVAQTGYSAYTLVPNEWYRLVISADLGSTYKYYLDGQLLQDGGNQALDGRFALYPQSNQNQVLFFADDNNEDNLIDVAEVRLYDVSLSATEVGSLGGYGHNIGAGPAAMLPFLQSPTTNSMYISWHCVSQYPGTVHYGASPDQMYLIAGATSQTLGTNYVWHTAHLTNLIPNYRYYYQCYTGDNTSQIYSFTTPPDYNAPDHFRFIILGDSQSNPAVSSQVVNRIAEKCEQLYGANWKQEINLLCHVGDTVGNGLSLSSFATEFFIPFAPLTSSIPTMISIGNHEAESPYYYDYMRYEDFAGPEGEKYYSFDLGDARFFFLNGNWTTAQQSAWFQQQVGFAEVSGYPYIFTFVHQPGHSELWPDGNSTFTQDTVIPILENADVPSILASGHSHNYEHGTGRNSHLHRLISGGAGGALDRWGMYANQTDYPETHKSLDHYNWVLVDIDMLSQAYTATTFSLGTPDLPRDNEIIDQWSYDYMGYDYPAQPTVLGTTTLPGNRVQVTLSLFSDPHDSFFSVGGDLLANVGPDQVLYTYSRDAENVYGDTGSPLWQPIDLNANLDRRRLIFDVNLTNGQDFLVRGWYRDSDLDKAVGEFTTEYYHYYYPHADFTVDNTSPAVGQALNFTDLSGAEISSWAWDFQNDGIVDSTERDPSYTYSQPGVYTAVLSIMTELGLRTATRYITVTQVDVNDPLDIPLVMHLNNYPNPFSQSNILHLETSKSSPLRVEVYNQRGQLVRTLFDGEMSAGSHQLVFDGCSDRGASLPSGVYFYKVHAAGEVSTGKMLLLK